LIAPQVDEFGNVTPVDTYGVQLEVGAFGAKAWRRSSVGLDYRGDYRKYTTARRFNGLNQALSLDYTFQPGRRIIYFGRLTGGTTNRAFGGFSAPTFADQQNFGVPLNEVYDSRANFGQLGGGVSYLKSARSTFTATAEGFVIQRKARELIGVQGYNISGSYDYRLTRSDTIGGTYHFVRFTFPRVYGESEVHGAVMNYRRRISRDWDLRFTGGLYRVNTTGTQQVDLSPEVAAVLGRSQGVEAFRRILIQPQVILSVNYTLERSRFTAGYQSGIGPGNGVYITSRQDGLRGGYSYLGIRKLSLGASVGYTRFSSVGLILGSYKTFQAGGGMNYRLAEHLDLSTQLDWRNFDTPSSTVRGRSGTSLTVGLSYSPARFPLSIW
jgi:hypothetical protein